MIEHKLKKQISLLIFSFISCVLFIGLIQRGNTQYCSNLVKKEWLTDKNTATRTMIPYHVKRIGQYRTMNRLAGSPFLQLARDARSKKRLFVQCSGTSTAQSPAAGQSERWLKGRRILIITPVWPEKTTTAAALRTWSLIEMLSRVPELTVTLASPARDVRGAVDALRAANVNTEAVQPNDPKFDSLVRDLQPDMTIFDRFTMEEMFGWRVAKEVPSCMRVLDTQDLHFLRNQRQTHVEKLLSSTATGRSDFFWKSTSVKKTAKMLDIREERLTRELASILRSDLTLLVSPFERMLLKERFGIAFDRLALAPFFYSDKNILNDGNLSMRSSDFVSIGNFRHPPNADSVRWLKEEIWPAIQSELKNPKKHSLRVYGAFPPASMMNLTNAKENFFVEGPAKCQYSTLGSHRCLLAPLRFGAGIKGKIADSWSVGTPVVTTPIGAEGMLPEQWETTATTSRGEKVKFGGIVANNLIDFAKSAARLVENESEWADASKYSTKCVSDMFGMKKGEELLLGTFDHVGCNLVERRKADWLQAMLLDDFHRSTEYKSRYIEKAALLREMSKGK